MRLILGALILANLREESHLVPLATKIQQMVAGLVSRIVSRNDNGPLARSLRNDPLIIRGGKPTPSCISPINFMIMRFVSNANHDSLSANLCSVVRCHSQLI